MTVSPTHSLNLAGLNAAMSGLGLIGKPGGPQQCLFYFVVPTDIYPKYQHVPGSVVPAGAALPANVALLVLEIPLQVPIAAAAAADASSSTAAAGATAAAAVTGKKRQKAEDADALLPPAKKAVATACDCATGCASGRCKCFKNGNKCGAKCHVHTGAACSNL